MSEAVPAVRRGRPPSGGREAILRAALDLLRERGASRLTTREVARRAGVSEGSLFYHFTDRSGLLTSVIEDGLSAVRALQEFDVAPLAAALEEFSGRVEEYLGTGLTAMIAAQSDAELRAALIDYMTANEMGPQRGIRILGAYLRGAQAAGTVRADVDPEVVAYLVIGATFLRVGQREMFGDASDGVLPTRDAVLATLERMLAAG